MPGAYRAALHVSRSVRDWARLLDTGAGGAYPLREESRGPLVLEQSEIRNQKSEIGLPALLRCPTCRGQLAEEARGLVCGECGRAFEVIHGIPDFRPEPAEGPRHGEFCRRVIERWAGSSYRELMDLYERPEGDALRRLWAEHEEQAPRRGERRWEELARYAANCGVRSAECGVKSEIRNPKSEMTMLDIGCGAGSALFGLASHAALAVGIDIMLADLLLAKKRFAEAGIANVAFVCGSARELPFADGCFGVLNATDVIEHVDDPGRLLAEARRVMGPGGVFFFNSPNRFSLLSREPHVKLWGVGWLPRRWAEPYVRWRRGKAYRGKRLLSLFELRRLLRAAFGRDYAIRSVLPRGRVARALVRPFEVLARPILPQHNTIAWRRESRTRDEDEGRGR